MESNSTWRRPLLVLALGLATQAGAQTAPAAPAAPAPSQTKPPLKAAPAKPGSGQTASLINGGGSTGNCPIGPDGMPNCEVVIDGKSDGDGSGGGVIPNLPADNFGNQAPVSPRILPPVGGSAGEDEKLAKWIKCGDAETAAQAQAKADYDFEMARCTRDNPDSSGSIGIGVTVNGTGATVTIPWDLIRNPAAKRAECEAAAKDKWQSATRYNKAVADSCRAKAQRGG
ncbi:MAG TPA: hypothetical protein VK195_03525 [Burkholderiaceae bacterium]|nr:hypothetical protein [Burkholderiaceae bacterium]